MNKCVCIIRKVGVSDKGRRRVLCVRVGGNCLKYRKRGWDRKEGSENKHFKKVGGGEVGKLS